MLNHNIIPLSSSEGSHLGVLSTTTTTQAETKTQLVLSVWKWPVQTNGLTHSDAFPKEPQQVIATTLDQVKVEQVMRLSLGRGLPLGRVTVMLAGAWERERERERERELFSWGQLLIYYMVFFWSHHECFNCWPSLVGEEVQVWRLQEGPLGAQLISTTIGFGLLAPDSIFTMWCLNPNAVR